MPAHVLLIRGINVGGKSVSMPTLRAALEEGGYDNVRTYRQSGNVVLHSRRAAARVAKDVRSEIEKAFGFDVAVIARSASQLADVVEHNPFLRPEADDRRQLLVAFLEARPPAAAVAALDHARAAPDELSVRGTEIYLWCPNGYGRSKIMDGVERTLGTAATVRNWRTTTELLRMAQGG
jgi:uncharacterized protein (DUF1697 family)